MDGKDQLNEHSGVPLWQQIAGVIAAEIHSGTLAIGEQAPTYRQVSDRWGVGRGTAMSALAELRRQGLVAANRKQPATVVRSPKIQRMTSERYKHGNDRSPVATDLDRGDHSATPTGQVSTELASEQVAARLKITPGDLVSRVDYRWADELSPFERSTQWEPLSVTAGTSAEVPPATGEPDVIARMETIGQYVTQVRESWSCRMPTAAESEELNMTEGLPVMACERTHFASTVAVETADITIRGDRTALVVDHLVGGEV